MYFYIKSRDNFFLKIFDNFDITFVIVHDDFNDVYLMIMIRIVEFVLFTYIA